MDQTTSRKPAKLWRVMTLTLLILALLLIVGSGVLFAISPGRPAPLRDDAGQIIAGSLSERVTVEIYLPKGVGSNY